MRVVIVSKKNGVYLGSFLGLGFFTLIDCAGQAAACTFQNETDAREYISTWETQNNPDTYIYVSVSTGDIFATVEELQRAGLTHLLGGMGKEDAVH